MDCILSHPYICVISDDGSAICPQLADSLTKQGWNVVVLSFPKSIMAEQCPLPSSINRVVLADMSEAHLKQQLDAIASHYGTIGAFIHLSPVTTTAEIAKATLKHVFLIAKYLKKSLNEAAQQGRSWFVTVSRLDGELGVGRKAAFSPISGGLFGLTKTLNLEWEKVFCRAIDISPKLDEETAVQSIITELYDSNRLITEVGYSSQGRATLVGETYPHFQQLLSGQTNISRDLVFLVSGGGRGITAQCAIALAQRFQCKFILLGRSTLNPEPIYAKGCGDERELKKRIIEDIAASGEKPTPVNVQRILKGIVQGREIQETLSQIKQSGSQIEYISVDVTDARAVQERVAAAERRLGKITGIVHGVGHLADKLIEHKTERDFEAVYTPKIQGLESLLSCVDTRQLDCLVLFSSAAAFYGNIGQSDYAIANEILNKFAHDFKHQHPDCHVVSFNWGPWDGGMVTPELKQIFAQRNIEVIPMEVGTQVFVEELAYGDRERVQVLVGSALATPCDSLDSELKTHRVWRKLSLEANSILRHHVIGNSAVLPTVFASAWLANTSEHLYPGYKFFSCENYKVLKGIVFDETLADEYILDLKEIEKSPNGEILLAAILWSETSIGIPRYHYSGQIKLLRKTPTAPIYEGFNSTEDKALASLYPYQDGTLFHGSSFQGVKQILNMSPEKLTMKCVLPKVEERQFGQIPPQAFNPIAADIQFQCMLIWVRHFNQAGSLPLRCQEGEHFREITVDKPFYVSMDVQFSNETKLIANITSHDQQGQVYSRVFGAEVTISRQLKW